MKIIINTGFMATLAPALLLDRASDGVQQKAASRLADVAQLHVEMIAAVGLAPSPDGFSGCDQAKKLVEWIKTPAYGDEGKERAELMNQWAVDIWSAITDLAAGKLPT